MKTPIFTGSGVALVTPFTKDGVDYDKLAELIEFHIENQTDAIIICGTTGEASTMPDAEHKEAIRFTVEKVAGRIPVIAGTGSNDTAHAIELSQYAESAGADGLLVVTPYYNKASQHGLYLHMRKIAESVKIPVILYNVPSRTGLGFTLDTLVKLDEIQNIVAVKEASGSIDFAAQILTKTDLAVYTGNDDMIIPTMSIGGSGVISVIANVIPKETHDMCALYEEGKTTEARDLFLKYFDLCKDMFIEVNPIPVKTALNLMGFHVGDFRMPLCEMMPENLAKLDKTLRKYNLISDITD